jgi:hypothetical protein
MNPNAGSRLPPEPPTKGALKIIEEHQCPGCVAGSSTKCGEFRPEKDNWGISCTAHTLGTSVLGVGPFALGMPKGFCRSGVEHDERHGGWRASNKFFGLSLIAKDMPMPALQFGKFNIPVWAMEREGHLYIRVAQPRRALFYTLVFEITEGRTKKDLCPDAVDVGQFYDEID